MANGIQQSSDLWDLEHYLTQRRKEIDRKYDYRGSRLTACVGETLVRKATPGGRAARLAGRQAEVDPFFRQILGRGRSRLKQPETPVEVYVVKVTLLGTSPPVWRRILVPREITLRNLHRTLQTVMGWTDSHLHQFVCQRQRLSDPRSRVGSKVADENQNQAWGIDRDGGGEVIVRVRFRGRLAARASS